jgi:hypothetical protein
LGSLHSEIIVINPSNNTQNLNLQILLSSTTASNHISIRQGNELLLERELTEQQTSILIENIAVSSGKNTLSLDCSEFRVLPPLSNIEPERQRSIVVDSISFV